MVRRTFPLRVPISIGTSLSEMMVDPSGSRIVEFMGALTAKVHICPAFPVRSVVSYQMLAEIAPRVSMVSPSAHGVESRIRRSWSRISRFWYRDPNRETFTLTMVGSTSTV